MRHPFKRLFLVCYALALSGKGHTRECFIASENNRIIHTTGECDTRYTPASTFKIGLSLMGFDAGLLIDETHPVWDFQPGHADGLARWKQPHNPKLWLAHSCVWYSQKITQKLGMDRFANYVHHFHYGNQDTSGDTGMNNGLTQCWLSSSLAISPKEHIVFLNKLVANTLPVSINAHEKTKRIMYQETLPNGWQLYSKTGNGFQRDDSGHKIKDKQVGWFVGFVRKGEKIITFVQCIADDNKQDTYASLRAKAICKERINNILININNDR
jgi:beta-lactamase class D